MTQIIRFLGLTENDLRTINDLRELIIDAGHLFPDSPHTITYDVRSPGHSTPATLIVHISQPIVDGYHGICDSHHSLVDSMHRLQVLCNRHSSFLLSNFLNLKFLGASSMSVLPLSFFLYFSKHLSVNCDILALNYSLTVPDFA